MKLKLDNDKRLKYSYWKLSTKNKIEKKRFVNSNIHWVIHCELVVQYSKQYNIRIIIIKGS